MTQDINETGLPDEREFEERSDNIKDNDLSIWNIENDYFKRS
jgi:hypothetical protein